MLAHLDHALTLADAFKTIYKECQDNAELRQELSHYIEMSNLQELANLHPRLQEIADSTAEAVASIQEIRL